MKVRIRVLYKYKDQKESFSISRDSDGTLVVQGEKIEKLFKMTNFNHEESIRRFARQLRSLGVDQALRERGAKDGDTVRILDYEFEFVDFKCMFCGGKRIEEKHRTKILSRSGRCATRSNAKNVRSEKTT